MINAKNITGCGCLLWIVLTLVVLALDVPWIVRAAAILALIPIAGWRRRG